VRLAQHRFHQRRALRTTRVPSDRQ
jgi:hypothetical protein